MKNFLFLIFTYFIIVNVNAQIVGSFRSEKNILKVEYKEFSVFTAGLVNEDKVTLYIADDFTFCKTEFQKPTFTSDDIINQDENTILVVEDDEDEYFNEIYINRKQNTLTQFLFEEKILKKKLAVEEKQPDMEWELLNEQKKIGIYNCEKAKTTFRGRTYEAYYTLDIPKSFGPWKLSGLPGLILSVKDLDGIYSWEATSVATINSNDFDLSKHLNNKSTFTKISYKEFDEKVINALKERNRMQNTRGGDNLKFGFSTQQDKEPINEWRTQSYFEF